MIKKTVLALLAAFCVLIVGGCHSHVHIAGYSVEENRIEPTCTEKGSYEIVTYCRDDGVELSREKYDIPPLGHDFVDHPALYPTYCDEGYGWYTTCTRCDYSNYSVLPRKQLVLNPKTYPTTIPTITITVGGAHIPDSSEPGYDDYCNSTLKYSDGQTSFIDGFGKVRVRETSSSLFSKKDYTIKFSSDVSIRGYRRSQKYNLLASYMDPTLLREYLAMQISRDLNLYEEKYSANIRPVKLYIDSTYKGIYYLFDYIEASELKINLAETTEENKSPFLLEMDLSAHEAGVEGVDYFVLGSTDAFGSETDIEYKLNAPETVNFEQFQFIENYITRCRQALIDKDLEAFSSLVDVYMFIDYFLLAELFHNTNVAGYSTYLYLRDFDRKLIFGPANNYERTCSRPYQLGPNTDYTLNNAQERFINYDFWKLFLEIEGADELIARRYTYYFRPIIEYELNETELYYDSYKDLIKENADIWYTEIGDRNALLSDNYQWIFNYFSLRKSMFDSLYYRP